MIRNVEIVKSNIPLVKIFFLPSISASLPNGRRKMAEARIKLLTIHPSSRAVALKSFPIAGRARLMADPMKGVRKAAKADTVSTDLFSVLSSAGGIFSFIGDYSFFFVSIMIVTGPSLCISTIIMAPNSPVPAGFPSNSESFETNNL